MTSLQPEQKRVYIYFNDGLQTQHIFSESTMNEHIVQACLRTTTCPKTLLKVLSLMLQNEEQGEDKVKNLFLPKSTFWSI